MHIIRENGHDFYVEGRDIHVYPLFGKQHEMTRECWCIPDQDEEHDNVLIHHQEH